MKYFTCRWSLKDMPEGQVIKGWVVVEFYQAPKRVPKCVCGEPVGTLPCVWAFSYDNIAARKFMPMDYLITTLKSGSTNRLHPYSLICDLPAHVCTCMCLVCVCMR